ncbi:unnamed protein product [Ilex paraguariensis]|uniref:Uncharacterized protein n=1 Tax=Ilex paraguariensis TaxID=185542 RepID=A0ABC8RTF7_9AQUA
MGKGSRLTTSPSERYLGGCYGYSEGQGTVIGFPELAKDDVWSMVDGMVNGGDQTMNGSHDDWASRATPESNGSVNSIGSHRRSYRDDHRNVRGMSLAFDDSDNTTSSRILHQFRGQDSVEMSPRGCHMATSAPVNVPDWTKIYRVDLVESLHDSNDCIDDGDMKMVPPHEYLAREYAHNRKISGKLNF